LLLRDEAKWIVHSSTVPAALQFAEAKHTNCGLAMARAACARAADGRR
jgi:hypothetical protein